MRERLAGAGEQRTEATELQREVAQLGRALSSKTYDLEVPDEVLPG
jgi:hypothetical protein